MAALLCNISQPTEMIDRAIYHRLDRLRIGGVELNRQRP